jgi:hypothetical protein
VTWRREGAARCAQRHRPYTVRQHLVAAKILAEVLRQVQSGAERTGRPIFKIPLRSQNWWGR